MIGFAGAYALAAGNLKMTSSLGIGSGAFPMGLAALLAFIGVIVLVQGIMSRHVAVFSRLSWRGLFLIMAAPCIFGLLVVPAGTVPALSLAVLTAALASKSTSLLAALTTTIVLVIFCMLVFKFSLGIPLRALGPWFEFAGT
ncbi:tripartite tricarboxylate transporter TctB family protein [Mesorhizobium sp. B2-6-1]|uniref:tripartite tricarboxylate transporter TctB family protein n=1 Tax=Mesorhizobium sp. B2-6-1 TaxID=2589916 RepID=UPI0015E2B5B4|nr:tripartite tricarboxylate transporter TctB family protein [Mesorhizobium sp. B2-6-1]